MAGLDPVKVLIVLLGAVMLLGPERLPRAARQLGSWWRELSKLREKLESEVRSAMPDLDIPKIPMITTRGVTGYITSMMQSTPAGGGEAAAAGVATATSEESLVGETAGAPLVGSAAIAGSSDRPGSRPATESVSGRSATGYSEWSSSTGIPTDVPAGWHSVGAEIPGYARGANLPAVPASAARGPITVEASLSFDEPSWN